MKDLILLLGLLISFLNSFGQQSTNNSSTPKAIISQNKIVEKLINIKDYFIPAERYKNAIFYMPNENGIKSEVKKIISFKKVANGYLLTTTNYYENQITSFDTSLIIVNINEINLKERKISSILVSNKHKIFSPPTILLKIPKNSDSITWDFINISGSKFHCISTWFYEKDINGELNVIPLLMVTKTTLDIEGKFVDFYGKGIGLIKQTFVNLDGKSQTLFQLDTLLE